MKSGHTFSSTSTIAGKACTAKLLASVPSIHSSISSRSPPYGNAATPPSIGTCISSGVDRLKANPGFAILGFLVSAIVGAIPVIGWGSPQQAYMRGLTKGKDASIGDIFDFSRLVPAIILFLITLVILMISMI